MKRVLATFLAAFAAATFGATFAPKEYVDMMDESNRVSAVQYTDESIHTLSTNVILKGEKRVGVGSGAVVESNGGVAVGVNSISSNLSSTAVGAGAEAKGMYSTAVGTQAKALYSDASAFGDNSLASKSDSLALGANSVSTGDYAVAVGAASTARGNYGIAIGKGAEAGNQSIAIGRDAKANHTAAVAIGPTAETTADNTMRIAYSPNEIYIGFFTPKTLTQTIIDTVGESPSAATVTNIVNDKIASANQFLRATDYGISGSTTQQVFSTSRSVSKLWGTWIASYVLSAPGSNSYRLEYGTNTNIRLRDNSGLSFNDSAKATFSSGTYAQFNDGAIVRIMNPDNLTFGPSGGSTNIAQYIALVAASDPVVANVAKVATRNSLFNLTYDSDLGVTWKKVAENGAFYERCYTNVNMIGVQP